MHKSVYRQKVYEYQYINVMDSRARFRMVMGFYVEYVLAPTEVPVYSYQHIQRSMWMKCMLPEPYVWATIGSGQSIIAQELNILQLSHCQISLREENI